jgi:hypothetical protein
VEETRAIFFFALMSSGLDKKKGFAFPFDCSTTDMPENRVTAVGQTERDN